MKDNFIVWSECWTTQNNMNINESNNKYMCKKYVKYRIKTKRLLKVAVEKMAQNRLIWFVYKISSVWVNP